MLGEVLKLLTDKPELALRDQVYCQIILKVMPHECTSQKQNP